VLALTATNKQFTILTESEEYFMRHFLYRATVQDSLRYVDNTVYINIQFFLVLLVLHLERNARLDVIVMTCFGH